eukprot:Gb_18506 [translate_table: standard]
MAESDKKTGRVKWFNSQKGFGFITPDDGGDDLFVHQTSIHADGFRSLNEGESVEYFEDQGEDGRAKALDVTGPHGNFVQGGNNGGYYGGGGRGRGRGGGGFGGGCYNCGDTNHLARDCPQERMMGSGGRGMGGGGACYNCGESGHFARDCPHGVR